MNTNLSLSISLISVFVILTGSCRKSSNPVNDAEISYWYNNDLHHYNFNNMILANVTFKKSVVYNQDTPHYHYVATFPFSSEKTISDISLFLYNDTLYPGQQFRLGNWTEPFEQYWQTFFISNDLTAMITRPGGTRYSATYFYADKSFVFNIDTISKGKASGRFEGYLFFYTDGVKTDSIELKQGVFRNVPIAGL